MKIYNTINNNKKYDVISKREKKKMYEFCPDAFTISCCTCLNINLLMVNSAPIIRMYIFTVFLPSIQPPP